MTAGEAGRWEEVSTVTQYSFAGALALALALTACSKAPPSGERQTAAASQPGVYETSGTVTEAADDRLTISHGPVAELGWPAMTMTFSVPSPDMARAADAGDRVRFAFRETGDGYALTSLSKAP